MDMPIVTRNASPLTVGTPLVTLEEVDAWREELRVLKQEREIADSKIVLLEQKLAAADFFIRQHASSKISADEQREDVLPLVTVEPTPATMHDAILRVIRKNPDGLEPKQIANVLRIATDLPLRMKQSHPNYIYTALKRLAGRDLIRKEGAVYKPVETKTTG